MSIEVVEELKDMCLDYENKQNRGSSFRPFRYTKYKDGNSSPVFFIGSPGLTVAIYSTFMIGVTFYMISQPFTWWLWVLYLLFGVFFLKLSIKMDKIKQVRGLSLALSLSSIRIIEIINNEKKDENEIQELLHKAKGFLNDALKWVEEPLISKQLEIVEQNISRLEK